MLDNMPALDTSGSPDAATMTPDRLVRLVNAGYEKMNWRRQHRRDFYRRLLGSDHGSGPMEVLRKTESSQWGAINSSSQPVNFTVQHVKSLIQSLAFHPGTEEVTATFSDHEGEAELHRIAIQQTGKKMNLREITQVCVIDAIAGESYMLTGLRASGQAPGIQNPDVDPGELFQEPVDFDDISIDPNATTWESRRFVARRFRISRTKAIQDRMFGYDPMLEAPINPNVATHQEVDAILGRLIPISRQTATTNERVSSMSGTTSATTSGDDDTVELWDVYWREQGRTVVFTIAGSQDGQNPAQAATGTMGEVKFLAVREHQGAEGGPVRRLTLFPAGFQMHPASLDKWQRELAVVADALSNKLIIQLLNAKQVNLYNRAQTDEADLARRASDGDWIGVDGQPLFSTVQMGGMIDQLVPGISLVMEQLNNITNNTQLAGGTNEMSKTATAYQGMANRVAGYLAFLQQRVTDFASECLRDRAFFVLNDPEMNMTIPFRVNDELVVPVQYTPAQMEGTYDHFAFTIEEGSMPWVDPVVEAQVITQFIVTELPAIVQFIGMRLLKPAAVRILARKKGIRNVDQIINDPQLDQIMAMAQMMGPPESQGIAPMAAQTPRGRGGGGGMMPKPAMPMGAQPQQGPMQGQAMPQPTFA